MSTLYVLDTSILLSGGKRVFYSFPGDTIVIPLVVVTELEKKRNDLELGLTARSTLRFIEELRSKGDIKKGVVLNDGTTVRLEINHVDITDLPEAVKREGGNDVRILAVARNLGATLVSRDLPLRIRAEVVGVPARDIGPADIPNDRGGEIPTLYFDDSTISDFFKFGYIKTNHDCPINSNVILHSHSGSSSGLGTFGSNWTITRVEETSAMGVHGRNSQQKFALAHLMDTSVPVVSLGGKAGSGKSLLALAAGIQQVRDGLYDRVVVFKTAHAVSGGDLGFLPGTEEEKFSGFTASVYDAMEAFAPKGVVERYIRDGILEILPVTHIRGRTFNNAYVILDESQNSELSTILTVLSRAGRKSKFVLTHDIDQRDNLHVGKHQGIYEAVQRMTGNKLFAHIEFTKSERSDVAEMAATLLADYTY